MYLSGECISEMLTKNGYSGYGKIYVSNEHRANKHSGKLFNIVVNDLGIRNDEMLFIGDNLHSDHRIPMSLGIMSIRYASAKERYAASHKREMGLLRKGCVGSSVIISMDMMRWLRAPFDNYWYEIAYRFGGPVSSFFIRFMTSQITENIGTILFIARDGYNLQKVYGILENDPLNNHYVYASRLFSMIFGDGADNKYRPKGLIEHFSGAEEMKDIKISDGTSGKDHAKCLAENSETFEKLLETERSRYSGYIHSKTTDEGVVLVVDATTKNFSSQNLIQKALGKDRDVIGCYYNLLAHGDQEHFAYADRSRKILNWTEVNVTEFFLGSPEAPVSDLTADGVPIFQKDVHDHELFRMSIYDRITEGELDYATDLRTMFGDDIPNVDHKVIDRWMKILVKNGPSGGEHISKIHWAPDTMHTRYRSLVFVPKEIPYKLADMFSDLKWRLRSK
jgi:predicted HAD superfamily hydrolase